MKKYLDSEGVKFLWKDIIKPYINNYVNNFKDSLIIVSDNFEGAENDKGARYVVRQNKLIAILKDGHVEYAPEGIAFVDAIAPTSFSIGDKVYNVPDGVSYVELGLTTPITTELYQKGIYNVSGIRRFGLYLDGSKNISLGLTFSSSADLEWLDLSGLDTSAVTYGFAMMRQNPKLHTILGKLSFPKVDRIDRTFLDNKALVNVDVSEMDLGMCKEVQSMFYGCSSLTTLDVSNWNTGACTTMNSMFYGCSSLTSLDVSKWDTSAVTNMQSMFNGCSSLTTLDVSRWNTSKCTKMGWMFSSCSSLTALDVSGWDTAAVTDMGSMFQACSSLTTLDVSGWDTAACTSMLQMFYVCPSLTTLSWPMMGKIKADATNNKTISLRDSPLDRASLESIFTYDRVSNGLTNTLTVILSTVSKALLTPEEIAAITAKGYTIA